MRNLPGDISEEERIERMIRVDHAGEFGAMRIYKGQLDFLPLSSPARSQIQHMADQEKVHFDTFDSMIKDRLVRPTVFMPLWNIAGYALGAATALLGEKAAYACTVAVESVIEEHYAKQKEQLDNRELALSQTIEQFRAEELEHHDISLEKGAEEAPFYPALTKAIRSASKLAIWISSRF